MFTSCFTAAATSVVGGVAWYALHRNGVTTPWLALALGLMLAIAVRSGGPDDAQTRGVLALLFYLVTASVTIFLIIRFTFQEIYGSTPDLRQLETALLYDWLTRPSAVVAWLGGAFVANWCSKLLR